MSRFRKRLCRVIKSSVSLLMAGCVFLSSAVVAVAAPTDGDGTSGDIITTFINLAKGQAESDFAEEGIELSEDQLRFLGVYASNFYVPFSTEFGEAGGEDTDATLDGIADALSVGLRFDDTYARTFAETITGLARGSVKDLRIAFSDEYQQDYVVLEDNELTLRNTYYNWLITMLGGTKFALTEGAGRIDYIDEIADKDAARSRITDLQNKTYGYWGYTNGNEFIPVADFYLSRDLGLTASQLAFINCLNNSQWESGYGWFVFDLNSSEMSGSDIQSGLGGDVYAKLLSIGVTMKVDCFGDILICGYQHQTVAVPGCVNPYTWVAVDAAGSDNLKPGEALNLINLPSLPSVDANTLGGSVTDSPSNTTTSDDGSSAESEGKTLDTLDVYRLFTLDRSQGVDSPLVAFWTQFNDEGRRSEILTEIGSVLNLLSSTGGSFTAVNNGLTDGYITVEAKIRDWKSLMPEFLNPDATLDDLKSRYSSILGSDSAVEEKYNAVQGKLGDVGNALLGNFYGPDGMTLYKLDTRYVYESINAAYSYYSGMEVSETSTTQETDEGTGRTSKLIKTLNWNDMGSLGFLSSVGNDNEIYFRVFKGTTETDLDGIGWPNSSKNTNDAMLEGVQKYTELYPYDIGPINSDWVLPDFSVKNYNHWDMDVGGSFAATAVDIMDTLVVIDQLGVFMGNGATTDYSTFPVTNYISSYGDSEFQTINTGDYLTEKWNFGDNNTFAAGYTNVIDGRVAVPSGVSESVLVSLYTTYLFASLYEDNATSKSQTIGRVGYRLNASGLPSIPSEPLELSEGVMTDVMLTSIRDWLYYLLHPVEGVNYVRELITNKLNGFLLGWHNDMLGTNGVGQTTGTTLYRSNTGYVTTPDLSEIEWTNSLINFYNQCIPFLLIFMLITMVFAYIAGILSLQRSLFGVVIFAIFLLIPVNLINGVVGISNRVAEGIYGEKFTYWALVQQESYASAIDTAATSDSYQNYLQTLYQTNNQVYSNQGAESIVLKWQAPKKMTSVMISNDNSYSSLTSGGQQLLNQFLGNSLSGESYLDEDSLYMFRSYLDIANYSRYVYSGIKGGVQQKRGALTNDITSSWEQTLRDAVSSIVGDFEEDRTNGYSNPNGSGNELSGGIKIVVPMSSKIYSDAVADKGTVADLTLSDYVGISPNAFNMGIPLFTKGGDYMETLKVNVSNASDDERDALEDEYGSYTNEDWTGLAAYALYSENVFYYFSWDLYDMGLQTSSFANSGYRNLLLGSSNAGFFYNTAKNGELKDFMDMRSLFTYIIPYLRMGNQLVHEWDDIYGLFIYDGVPTEEGHWNDADIAGNAEMTQKYWHNLNVARLYCIYCPWVDIMYDCSYADGEVISAVGEEYLVEDPIDPASYPDERPMIFSESEMLEYGLGEGDLTKVERLILECNRGMQERMYELLNYYNFSDVTLNTAAAMNCAFEFNITFSENGIFESNHNIYPQSFELSDFSYDAFLRFILSNTTGEPMNTTDDFYANVVGNSSLTTVLVMLILDILSMYVLPAFKIFFVIAVFISALFIVVTTAFRVDPSFKFIRRLASGVLLPMLQFMLITIGFAYVISLFMGVGNDAVTQSHTVSIQMGDPVVVMLAMCAADIIVLILYFKVIRKVVRDIKQSVRLSANFVGGVFGGVGALAIGAVGGAMLARRSSSSGSRVRGSDEGTGVESPRAATRGSRNVEDSEENPEPKSSAGGNDSSVSKNATVSTRQNDSKRETVKPEQQDKKLSKEESDRKKESLNKKTKSGVGKMTEASSKPVSLFGRDKKNDKK